MLTWRHVAVLHRTSARWHRIFAAVRVSSGSALAIDAALTSLNLIGFVSRRDYGTRLRWRDARCCLVLTSRDGRLRGFDVWFGNFRLRLISLVQFVVKFVLCFLKLLYGLPHSACELGQFLRSEQNENDQQDDDQVRPGQVHEAGEEAHNCANIKALSPTCKEFQQRRGTAARGPSGVDS
jgi:hypothetical protein